MKKVRLSDVVEINPKFDNKNIKLETEVSFIPMQSVSEDGQIVDIQLKPFAEVKKGYTPFIENDILFAKITPCMENGKRAIAKNLKNGLGFGSTEFHVLRPKAEVHPKYLYYFISQNQFRKQAEKNMTGSAGQKRVPVSFLKSISLWLPSIEKQEQIIEILDKAQELINYRKAQIESLDQLTQSMFLKMFGDPIINSEGYSFTKLTDICTKITDGTHDTPERISSGVMLITGKNIKPFKIDFSDLDYVSEEDHRIIYSRCNPEFGDILYTNIGVNLGTAVMNYINEEFSMKNVALLKLKRELINSRYIEFLLNNQGMKNKIIEFSSSGGAQKFLSLNKIKQVEVPVPPLDLQLQFSTIVEEVLQRKDTLEKGTIFLEELYQSLIQRAFKGELFNEENVSKL